MMVDELDTNKEMVVKSCMNIYGRGRFAQSSSHRLTDEQEQRKLISRKVLIQACQEYPVFLIASFCVVGENCPSRKEVSRC
jgi:hypothetical protein